MSLVFVSYDPSDADFAQHLMSDLQAANISIADASGATIEDATTILIIVSPASMASEEVQHAIDFATDYKIRLIPVSRYLARVVPTLRDYNIVDCTTEARYMVNLPSLIEVLGHDAELTHSVFPTRQNVDNSRYIVGADLARFLSVLTVIAAPIADESGDGPPTQRREPTLAWQKIAAGLPALDADGMAPIALKRLMPPSIESLGSELTAMPHQVLYIHSYLRDDALVLEDEWGQEQSVFANTLINALSNSTVKVLILVGSLPLQEAETLLEETAVDVIIQLDDRLDADTLGVYVQGVLWQLANGQSVQEAHRVTLSTLATADIRIEHQVQLIRLPNTGMTVLALPSGDSRAPHSLIISGMPPLRNVPTFAGFVGHRRELLELNREITEAQYRQIALYGPIEAGKSWLAAEYVARHAWRYPDGVLWMRISAQTKSEDVIGQLLALLELPPTTNWATLREIMRERSILIVLDQLDEWDDPLEVGELADFIARLDQLGGTRVLLTAWGPVQPITFTSGTEENNVEELAPDEARHLALQYIDRYGVGGAFDDAAKLEAFLAKTHAVPWLIREGMQFILRRGYADGMNALSEIIDDVADPFETHMSDQINTLSDEAFAALRNLQGLPDGFDRAVLEAMMPTPRQDHIREMLVLDMLQYDGRMYRLSAMIRSYLQHYAPLAAEEQAAIDERVIETLLGEQL